MKKRLGLIIDQERCIGCEACTIACEKENNPSAGHWIRVKTSVGAKKDTPSGQYPNLQMHFLPLLCMHCDHPPCVDACPLEALFKREDGPVVLDEDRCNGCRLCVEVCPYDAIRYCHERGKIEKCTLCTHRIDQGLEPFCVICCEGQAMHFGDLNDPSSAVSDLVERRGAFLLEPEEGTNPSVYYCPPREPRRL